MKELVYYEVSVNFSEDGRGYSSVIGCFSSKEAAEEYAKGRNNWGRDGYVSEKALTICDTVAEQETADLVEKKKEALAKLTEEERDILGLGE